MLKLNSVNDLVPVYRAGYAHKIQNMLALYFKTFHD